MSSAQDGLIYYFNELNLNSSDFLLQFNGGFLSSYSGINNPQFSLNSLNFPQEINSATGLNSPTNRWTHFFIYNRLESGQGILFSSFIGTYPYSGYAIGLTDDNKVYYETYDNNGPVVKVGSHINPSNNALAVTLDNTNVNFNYFDFNSLSVTTESFPVQNQYLLPSNIASLGGVINFPSYTSGAIFPGTIETYAYMTEAYSASYLESLFSGFYSYYDIIPGEVTSYSYYQVTGYQEVPYGYSGITGYGLVYEQIGTGFGGIPISGYSQQPISGFIQEGSNLVALSGLFTVYQTGDSSGQIVYDPNIANSFGFDKATLFNIPSGTGFNYFYGSLTTGQGLFNLLADYDNLKNVFELNQVYDPSGVNLYLDGVPLFNLGYSITGNIYNSGYNISGDYFLTGFDVYLKTSEFGKSDTMVYDVINFGESFPTVSVSGVNFTNLSGYQAKSSKIFVDNYRLTLDEDYVENSKFDFLKQKINFENTLQLIYNDDGSYFES